MMLPLSALRIPAGRAIRTTRPRCCDDACPPSEEDPPSYCWSKAAAATAAATASRLPPCCCCWWCCAADMDTEARPGARDGGALSESSPLEEARWSARREEPECGEGSGRVVIATGPGLGGVWL